jgi:hypothetical protein
MPSLAGAAGLRYRPFTARVLVLRVPWLAAALGAGALAADYVARFGHVAGVAGLVISGIVAGGLLIARHRAALARLLARRIAKTGRQLSSTIL